MDFPCSPAQHRTHLWKITCKQHRRTTPSPLHLPSTGNPCVPTAGIALPSAAQRSGSPALQILPSTNPQALHAKTLRLASPAQSTTACAQEAFVAARSLTASGLAKTYRKGSSPERAGLRSPIQKTRCFPHSKPPDSYIRCSGPWLTQGRELSIPTPQIVQHSSGTRSNTQSAATCRTCFHWIFKNFTPR